MRGGPFTVCLTEPIHPDWAALLTRAATIRYAGGHDEAGLAVADADGLILRVKGRVTDSLLARAPHLKVIARHGVGVDNVGAHVKKCVNGIRRQPFRAKNPGAER